MSLTIKTDKNGFIIIDEPLFDFFDLVYGGRLQDETQFDFEHVNVPPWKYEHDKTQHSFLPVESIQRVVRKIELKPLDSAVEEKER